ncbi:hypothetical protein [Streptomyces sp. H27-D2]|uniref:hypothetical protein n=1 Tax=Streptomyces sp. H27-D2 TaxID=3046304 RepID=UPI002DB5F71D|nr:hypothetical protein [Streptomyces sp. H27-D2]MEC4018881.1 hypothetical protein [Streptomyces sp. H27-D2]
MIALASVAALAVALPLAAATAGPAGSGEPKTGRQQRDPQSGTADGRDGGQDGAAAGSGRRESAPRAGGGPDGEPAGHGRGDGEERARGGRPLAGIGLDGPDGARRASHACGPELASPEGIEAQTCVLTEGRDTWARTYYRNATGGPLHAVLSLMRPDGRTRQAHCEVREADEPGVCETPRQARVQGTKGAPEGQRAAYTAVAEIASADGERLLLRSGSNAPVRGGAAAPGSGGKRAADAGHGSDSGADSGYENARSLATGDAPATGLQER